MSYKKEDKIVYQKTFICGEAEKHDQKVNEWKEKNKDKYIVKATQTHFSDGALHMTLVSVLFYQKK